MEKLTKEKVTVKVSRWCNVYDETNHSQEGVGRYVYTSKEDAILNKSQIGYITTIELTGEYTTEVEDPLMS